MIPEAAVEAAARSMAQPAPYDFDAYPKYWMERTRIALEAAAPHMLAQVWDDAIASLRYEDGSAVDVMSNTNPYRSNK